MSNTTPKLQIQAGRTLELLQRIADGLEKLNDEKLEPTAALLESVTAAKGKANGASAPAN